MILKEFLHIQIQLTQILYNRKSRKHFTRRNVASSRVPGQESCEAQESREAQESQRKKLSLDFFSNAFAKTFAKTFFH